MEANKVLLSTLLCYGIYSHFLIELRQNYILSISMIRTYIYLLLMLFFLLSYRIGTKAGFSFNET